MVQDGPGPLRVHIDEDGPVVSAGGGELADGNCLGAPMMYEQTLLGSICFCRDAGDGPFNVQDEELLRLFASQAAVAIQNARLSEQIQDMAVLQERDRIAREMHDGMAQVLGYINTQTIGIKKLLDDEKLAIAREELSKMECIARELYGDVREGILGLRIAAHADKGLVPVLREYVEHYRDMSGLDTVTNISNEVEDLEISTTDDVQLLRIVQEALTNVRKHSGAKTVSVNLDYVDDRLCIHVDDDGKGFDPDDLPTSNGPRFGLRVMEERAMSLGGDFSITSIRGGGTRVIVRVPAPINHSPASHSPVNDSPFKDSIEVGG
jgi:signal transduction histidine kinase